MLYRAVVSGECVDNELLDGFYLKGLLVKPTTGLVTGARGSQHLPSKAMEVLLHLAKHPRRLVTREEILNGVWGDTPGTAEALNRAVGEIRRALGDHASTPEFVQTVPTRGYRLLVEPTRAVESMPSDDVPQTIEILPSWQALIRHGVVQAGVAYLVVGWLLIQIADAIFADIGLPPWSKQFITFSVIGGFPVVILLAWFLEFAEGKMKIDDGQRRGGLLKGLERNYLAIIAAYGVAWLGAGIYQTVVGFEVHEPIVAGEPEPELIPIAENSLAVLRLLTIGDDSRMGLFSDGLSEDLIDALARLPGLSVSSRGDSWSLPVNATSEMVRRRLRVGHFIEGSVRVLDENLLRVVVQLIDSETGFHIVSRGFEFELEGFADLQKEISSLIVANLRLALDVETIDFSVLPAEHTAIDAYLSYRRGLQELYKPRSEASISAGIAHFSDALKIDADYPAAHSGLCSAYTTLYGISRDPADIETAEKACAQAYAVGPQLPLVLNAVGTLYLATGKNAQAHTMFEDALNIDDRYVPSIKGLAVLAERALEFDKAEQLIRRAIDLQPGNLRSMGTLADLYFGTGRYAEAAHEYRKILFITPDNFAAIGNLGAASLMAGDFETARDSMEQSLEIEFDPLVASNLGIVHYYLGDFARSVEIHKRVIEASPNTSGSRVNLGDALHFSGDTVGATDAFNKAIELARSDLSVNPEDPEALTYLAWSLTMTGDIDEGLRTANRALVIDPRDPYSHYYVGLIQMQNQKPDAAIDALEKALANGYEASMLTAEPYVQPLRTNQRFNTLLAQYGLTGE